MRRRLLLLAVVAAASGLVGAGGGAAAQTAALDWVWIEGELPTDWSATIVPEVEGGEMVGGEGMEIRRDPAPTGTLEAGNAVVTIERVDRIVYPDEDAFRAQYSGGGGPFPIEHSTEQLDGIDFWLASSPGGAADGQTVDSLARTYYANVDGGSVQVRETVHDLERIQMPVPGQEPLAPFDFEGVLAEADLVVTQLRFDFSTAPEAPSEPASEPGPADASGEDEPWKTVVGGVAAAVAAAAALAAAVASVRGRSREIDPDATVGHVLQLSTDRITLATQTSQRLDISVWRATGSGRLEPEPGATIQLTAPSGVGVSPATGRGQMTTALWQTAAVDHGSTLTVTAAAGGGGTRGAVHLLAEEASALVLTTVPEAPGPMRPDGRHVVRLVATLKLGPAAAADPAVDPEAARATISIAPSGDGGWVDTGTLVDVAEGKALDIALSPPDPDHPGPPPELVTISAAAQVGQESLRETLQLHVERPPVIDCRPDLVEAAAGSAEATEVVVWVAPGGGRDWAFGAGWRAGDPLDLATVEVRQDSPSSAVVTVTEAAGGDLVADRPEVAATLVLTADHPDWSTLERSVRVILSAEGLFVDALGRHPADGTHHLAADGTATSTEIAVRVHVRDDAGRIAFDPTLSRSVVFEADEDSPGAAAWRHHGVLHQPGEIRPGNLPAALHTFRCERTVPTGDRPLRLQLRASVPGCDGPAFTALVPMSLVGVDTAPYSAAWELELERCRYIVDTFVPAQHRSRLHTLLNERAKTFGAEGLYQFRHRLWDFAETQVTAEAHDHLDQAWWYEQVEDTLDWVSWCGDIALGVASGQLTGTAATIGVGLLKPVLVSAVTAWYEGQSIDGWAWGQVAIFAAVIEGAATDVDVMEKLTGGNRAKAWAAFIAYSFVRELTRDADLSVTEAMTNACRNIRDQALVEFLKKYAGKGQAPQPGASAEVGEPRPVEVDAPRPVDVDPARPVAGAPAAGRPVDSRTVTKVIGRMKHRNGKPYADIRDVVDIMCDPEATRSLKGADADPVAREAFENTRQEVYRHHDADLRAWVEENVAGLEGQEVRVAEVRTPGVEPGFNTDRDYRVLVRSSDPVTGVETWIEVPRSKWEGASHEIFAEHTGGPSGDPKAAQAWAEARQQVGTDRLHFEASPDMSDQVFIPHPDGSGRMVATQCEPNLARVKRGESTLQSPESLGRVYQHKITHPAETGHKGEGYAQAAKAVRDTRQIRDSYRTQGFDVGEPSSEMRQAMDIVERTGRTGFDDPNAVASAEAQLRKLDIGGISDFAKRLSGQVESLKWVRKP